MKGIAALFVILIFTLMASAQDSGMRSSTMNVGGRCAWATLDGLFRHNQMERMRGKAMRMPDGKGSVYDILTFLQENKVPYFHTYMRSQHPDRFWPLRAACRDKRACMVAMTMGRGAYHAVAVVKIDERYVYVVDPNRPGQVEEWVHGAFDQAWHGLVFVVFPNEQARVDFLKR